MVAFAVERFGRLDGALNNAGIEMRNKPVHELTDEDWRNRQKWESYEEAVEEMLVKTSTRTAPSPASLLDP